VAFECDERLRGPLESMSGELVDFRLAAHARLDESPHARITSSKWDATRAESKGKS
jgi:hypothetical protein